MRLPNADLAVIEPRKLRDYLLSPTHPHGRSHALLFERLLGIDQANSDLLRAALLTAARDQECIASGDEGFGAKYEVRFPMSGPRGVYTVLSVWIIPTGDIRPHLVTAYIE